MVSSPIIGTVSDTDGKFTLIRKDSSGLYKFSLWQGSQLKVDNGDVVEILNGQASVSSDNKTINISNASLQYIIYGPNITKVIDKNDNNVSFKKSGDYIYINTTVVSPPPKPPRSTPPPDEPVIQPSVGSLAERLKGYILLQVEELGEAWYVKQNGYRIYMKNGDIAYNMMRELGLGITDADLAKIPVGIEERFAEIDSDNDGLGDKLEEGLKTDPYNNDSDGDGYLDGEEVKNNYNPLGSGSLNYDYNLSNRLLGRILLQVEALGQAWYINPVDGKRYYMKDGDSAYQIMRYLSLGITNSDLNLIPEELF